MVGSSSANMHIHQVLFSVEGASETLATVNHFLPPIDKRKDKAKPAPLKERGFTLECGHTRDYEGVKFKAARLQNQHATAQHYSLQFPILLRLVAMTSRAFNLSQESV